MINTPKMSCQILGASDAVRDNNITGGVSRQKKLVSFFSPFRDNLYFSSGYKKSDFTTSLAEPQKSSLSTV